MYLCFQIDSPMQVNKYPANIRLDEDVLKKSFVFYFRRRLQDVLIKTNIFASVIRLQKRFSRRLEDVLVKTNIFVLIIRLQDVFKTFSRRLQDLFKTSSKRFAKTSSRHLQDVFNAFWRRLQNVFKKYSRHLQDVLQRCLQDVFKLLLLTRFRDVFNMFLRRTAKTVIYKRIYLGHTFEKFMVSVQNLQE